VVTIVPNTVFRGEKEEYSDFHRDGRVVFFTDDEREALGYGPSLIEARLHVGKMFDPAEHVYRKGGDWVLGAKKDEKFAESEAFLFALYDTYSMEKVEAIYHNVEGGSWSEVERAEIQTWLRKSGYESFICWEGDGMTYAVYDPDNIEIVSRSLVQMPGMT
jgi:hypothetical protein